MPRELKKPFGERRKNRKKQKERRVVKNNSKYLPKPEVEEDGVIPALQSPLAQNQRRTVD